MTDDDEFERGNDIDADDDARNGAGGPHDAREDPTGDDPRDGSTGGDPGPYGDYDPDEIRGPLTRQEENGGDGGPETDVAGIRSSGSNGHEPPDEDGDETPGSGRPGPEPDEPWFEEVQRFRQRWVWLAFGILAAYAAVTVALNDVATWLAALLVGVPVGALALLYVAKLRTVVDGDGIHVEFFPFHRTPRTIPFEEVVEYEAVEYDPVREYYGWGIRRGLKGWAYNVSGNEGVRIEREPKVDVLIGSQRPEELESAVATGVATTDTVAHHGGDRGPRWQAVAQFRDDDEDLRGFDEHDDPSDGDEDRR